MRIGAVATPRLEWAVGREVSLPVGLLPGGAIAGSSVDLRTLPCPPADAATNFRLRAAFTEALPLSSRMPFSYQWVPAPVRDLIGRSIGSRLSERADEWGRFPRWPLDLSADVVADWTAGGPAPSARPAPVLLTHDIDSPEGLRNLVDLFLPLTESFGARVTAYVVPNAWPLDHGLLQAVVDRGHAIGVHGYDHANRTPFVDDAERRQRLAAGKATLERYSPAGYRAPSLLRTSALLAALPAFFRFDSSIPTSGGPFPVPNNGCASARPFLVGETLEIPVTLPRDGSLIFLGYSPAEILELWKKLAADIASARGLVMLLTHCERRFSGAPIMFEIYRRFLDFLAASPMFQWSTPDQIAGPAA